MNTKNTLRILGGIVVLIAGYLVMSPGANSVSAASVVARNSHTQAFTDNMPTALAKNSPTTPTPTSTSHQTSNPATIPSSVKKYKDGRYTAAGNYFTPEGPEEIDVSLVLKNGIIADSSLVQSGFRRQSVEYQGIFASNYKQYVIGKSIDEVNLSLVSGSSLTPGGFNDALTKIKIEARAS